MRSILAMIPVIAASGFSAMAQTWTAPQFIGNGAATAVSTNGTGTAAVIYRETAGAIKAAVAINNVWAAPVTLAASGQTGTIAVASNGDILAVWAYRATDTYIPNVVQAAFYSGGRWGSPTTLSANVYGNVYSVGLPSIGFDGNSRATAIWEEMAANASTPCTLTGITGTAGAGFGARQAISAAGTCYGWTTSSVNHGGQAVAVEGVPGILSGAVVAFSREISGNWGAGVTLEASQYRQRQPRVALSDDGAAVAVWTQRSTGSYSVRSPAGVWSAAAPLPGVSNTTNTSYVVIDGSGNAVVAYQQSQLPAGLLTMYRPNGGSWQSPVLLENAGPVGAGASALGTFVVASGDAAFVRPAGSSTWQKSTFANGVTSVGSASGQAIVSIGPQVYVSMAVIP
jgi:hypothetical protein